MQKGTLFGKLNGQTNLVHFAKLTTASRLSSIFTATWEKMAWQKFSTLPVYLIINRKKLPAISRFDGMCLLNKHPRDMQLVSANFHICERMFLWSIPLDCKKSSHSRYSEKCPDQKHFQVIKNVGLQNRKELIKETIYNWLKEWLLGQLKMMKDKQARNSSKSSSSARPCFRIKAPRRHWKTATKNIQKRQKNITFRNGKLAVIADKNNYSNFTQWKSSSSKFHPYVSELIGSCTFTATKTKSHVKTKVGKKGRWRRSRRFR